MPVMDGSAFARAHRARGAGAPIVVMTAAPGGARWAEEIGADGVLEKPFSLDDVSKAVGQACGAPYGVPPATSSCSGRRLRCPPDGRVQGQPGAMTLVVSAFNRP